ncbi:hypothetical protein [Actinoplanes sp. NPDC051851]|uniref:hypothetical protein n=1 Tax=Actinoplanes sp. NPDC051851 TaxID=3154753 RepID=UPI003445B483
MSTDDEHLHDRPHWNCRVCGAPWPCDPARERLLREYRAFPSLLRVYLSSQMYDAIEDMPAGSRTAPHDLYERFLAWTRDPPERL